MQSSHFLDKKPSLLSDKDKLSHIQKTFAM